MWKTPTRREMSQSCGRAAGKLPASDPLPRPYSPPFEDTANTLCGYASDTTARTTPHRLAGRAGSAPVPLSLQYRFVSIGPRYPSGRILHCDASVASEVALAVSTLQLTCVHACGAYRRQAAHFGRALCLSLAHFRRNCTLRPASRSGMRVGLG